MTTVSPNLKYKNLKKVLIAEDDVDLQLALKLMIQAAGLKCEVTSDGETAFQKLLSGGFDLLVTDFRMPKLDGVDLLKKCREAGIHIPVIFQSSDADMAPREQIALADCCATLMYKPINRSVLLAALGAADNRTHHLDCLHVRSTPVR